MQRVSPDYDGKIEGGDVVEAGSQGWAFLASSNLGEGVTYTGEMPVETRYHVEQWWGIWVEMPKEFNRPDHWLMEGGQVIYYPARTIAERHIDAVREDYHPRMTMTPRPFNRVSGES